MEKANYEKLKSIDSSKLYWEIRDFLRGKLYSHEGIHYITSMLFGSYLMKKNNITTQKDLVSFVDKEVDNGVVQKLLREIFEDNYSFKIISAIAEKESIEVIGSAILFGSSNVLSSRNINESHFITPDSITKLAIKILDIKSTDTIYDATSGASNFLIEASMESGSTSLFGTELNREAIILSKIKEYILNLEINIELKDTLEEIPGTAQPNKVFSDSPFGMKARSMEYSIKNNLPLKEYLSDTKVFSGDWIFATSAMLAQQPGGKTIVTMISGSLSNEADKEIREKLIKDRKIEAVISLPSKLYSNTSIPVNLLVLSENNETIRMINATNHFTELNRTQNNLSDENIEQILEAYTNNSEISKEVYIETLQKEDYVLSPIRYMGYLPDESDGLALSEISIDIIRGAMISKKELDKLTTEKGDYKYIQIKDINNGMLNMDLPMIKHIDKKYEKSIVQSGDILASKTAPFKFTVVEINEDEKVIATGNLYIIRPDQTKIDPTYLAMYLQSKAGENQLERYVTGTAIQTISVSALKKLIIPEKDIITQKQLVKDYKEYQEDLILIDKQKEFILNKQKELLEEAF